MIVLPGDNAQRVQGLVVATGLLTFVCVGVAACLALVAAVFFLVVQFVLIVLQSVVEAFGSMAAIWVAADPFIKVIILAALVFGAYKLYQWHMQKRVRK